jgi:hypothetical protein
MKHLFLTLLLATLCAATGYGQTMKALMYNTTNGVVAYSGTNQLTFTNTSVIIGSLIFNEDGIFYVATNGAGLDFQNTTFIDGAGNIVFDYSFNNTAQFHKPISFNNTTNAATTLDNLGLGATNNVVFNGVSAGSFGAGGGFTFDAENGRILDGTDELFSFNTGLITKGDLTVTQTGTNNGLLFIRRTNNEPFLGLANLIASNNTTISNETLFRVGTAEATNRSAQFGFRSTNTNGSGVAVFSVFGYNALAMIGPSARSATNTNGIEADIYSINPTNKVATLIDTNTGATLMHRPVGFATNASTPSSTNTIVGWIQFFVGTNSVRVPYYQ